MRKMVEIKNPYKTIEKIEKGRDMSKVKPLTKTDLANLERVKESSDFIERHDTILERVRSIIKYDKSARKGRNSYLWLLMVYYAKCNMIKLLVPLQDFYKATPPASIERARRELYKRAKMGDESLRWLLNDEEFLEEMNKEEGLCHDYYQQNKNSEIVKRIK